MSENDEYLYSSLSRGDSRSEFTARKNYCFAEVFFDAPGNERNSIPDAEQKGIQQVPLIRAATDQRLRICRFDSVLKSL